MDLFIVYCPFYTIKLIYISVHSYFCILNKFINMSEHNRYNGTFEFADECAYLENAHTAISRCELWEWLRTFDPPSGQGFMFCNTPELARITVEMNKEDIAGGHSGASYGCTMRAMQFIAIHGFAQYKADYLRN